MTPDEIANRLAAIYEQKVRAVAELKAQLHQQRTYADGAVLSRTRYNEDGSLSDHIIGTVVGSAAFEVDNTINVQYWVRVDSPADYRSHQQCDKYNLPLHTAEDFWQGDERWQLIQ